MALVVPVAIAGALGARRDTRSRDSFIFGLDAVIVPASRGADAAGYLLVAVALQAHEVAVALVVPVAIAGALGARRPIRSRDSFIFGLDAVIVPMRSGTVAAGHQLVAVALHAHEAGCAVAVVVAIAGAFGDRRRRVTPERLDFEAGGGLPR